MIVFSSTLALHEFIYALVFITRSEWRTLNVGVPSELILGDVFFWQPLLRPLRSSPSWPAWYAACSWTASSRASPPARSRVRLPAITRKNHAPTRRLKAVAARQ